MRNRQSDAHGTDSNSLQLSESEAVLCVNLAGAAALYFLQVFERGCHDGNQQAPGPLHSPGM